MPFPVNNIRRQCAINGITIAELERELGFGNGVIARWERNKAAPPYDRLKQIADRFGITVEELSEEKLYIPSGPPKQLSSGLRLPEFKKPASVSADGIRERVANLPPELQNQFLRFVQLALKSPEKASRYLAFVCQELESDQ